MGLYFYQFCSPLSGLQHKSYLRMMVIACTKSSHQHQNLPQTWVLRPLLDTIEQVHHIHHIPQAGQVRNIITIKFLQEGLKVEEITFLYRQNLRCLRLFLSAIIAQLKVYPQQLRNPYILMHPIIRNTIDKTATRIIALVSNKDQNINNIHHICQPH